MLVLQLLEVECDNIHLRFPVLVYFRAFCKEVVPLLVGEFRLYSVFALPDGVIVFAIGRYGVPHKCDDGSFVVPFNGVVDSALTEVYTVERVVLAVSEILTEHHRMRPREVFHTLHIDVAIERVGVLAGESAVAALTVDKVEKFLGFGRSVLIYRVLRYGVDR